MADDNAATVGATWAERWAPSAPAAEKATAAELYDSYIAGFPRSYFARSTPPSIAYASGAASVLAPWRNPRAIIIGADDE